MSTLTLEIPAEFARSLGKTTQEAARNAQLCFGVAMYRDAKWSIKRAADFCGLNRLQFMEHLRVQQVEMPYTKQMIEEDLAHAHRRR
jgi:Uncharacterised protein family (UPF0175)